MTKEQFKAIANEIQKMKANIDNIMEKDVDEFHFDWHGGTFFFYEHAKDGLHFFPVSCDLDDAEIRFEHDDFFVLDEEF